MSVNKGIIKKYAKALYKVAVKENDINQISTRLHRIRSILKSVPKLSQLLSTRRVQVQDKMIIMKNILGNKISDIEEWIPGATDIDRDGDIYLNRIYRVYILHKTCLLSF